MEESGKDPCPQTVVEEAREEVPLRQEYARYDHYYSTKDSRKHYRPTSIESDKAKKFSKYVLIVIKKVNHQGLVTDVEVQVRGKLLRDVLAKIFSGVEEARLSETPPIIPPQLLYHARDELHKRRAENETRTILGTDTDDTQRNEFVFELSAAIKLIDDEYGNNIKSIGTMLQEKEITFETLWQILRPNELVFWKDELGEPGIYRYESHSVKQDNSGRIYMVIKFKGIDDDGKHFGLRHSRSIELDSFRGAKKIARLPLFPLRFHPEREQVQQELTARGRKWLKLRGQHFKDYSGLGLLEKRRKNSILEKDTIIIEKFNSHGRLMIDPATYGSHQANNVFVPQIVDYLDPDNLTEEEMLLLPSKVYGFCFGDKIWGAYAVRLVEDIVWDYSIYDSLILRSKQKETIRKVVKSHLNQQSGFDDFVKDKGLGLIGLLTGPPGVGKTLTAEAVAEILERPLYVITSGELGDTPQSIDLALRKVLELANDWNAVVLLDEADVFLAKRDRTDLIRNGIVSIFLRQLEYYRGILFLTTNRMDDIDDAFLSRIHFTHLYPALTVDVRKGIWKSFLQRAAEVPGMEVNVDEDGIAVLAMQQINGRQIKNAMKIAQSMAAHDREPLTVDSIMGITDLVQEISIADKSNEVSLL